jgi:hypothetical protein
MLNDNPKQCKNLKSVTTKRSKNCIRELAAAAADAVQLRLTPAQRQQRKGQQENMLR